MLRPILCSLVAVAPLFANTSPNSNFDFSSGVTAYPDRLEVNNRVLIKINGQAISVIDVVRRMDLVYFRQYPDYLDQPTFRCQFYKENWRAFLQTAIDDQLVLADAEEKKVEVTEGELRERMQEALGPDVVFTIERLGLEMDEATEMIKTEILVGKMKGGMVHMRALSELNPKLLRQRYEEELKANPPKARYVYQVLSFKGDETKALSAANQAHQLLTLQQTPINLIGNYFSDDELKINISSDYSRLENEISQAHKVVLETLSDGAFSEPIIRRSVAYIFHLKQYQVPKPPTFNERSPQIKQEMLEEFVFKYDSEYKERLRKKYGITEQFLSQLIPEETQPFALR